MRVREDGLAVILDETDCSPETFKAVMKRLEERAFRNTAVICIEGLNLGAFENRIPHFEFNVRTPYPAYWNARMRRNYRRSLKRRPA